MLGYKSSIPFDNQFWNTAITVVRECPKFLEWRTEVTVLAIDSKRDSDGFFLLSLLFSFSFFMCSQFVIL